MFILAADTTTSFNTIAICDGSRVRAETLVDCGRAHSERLLDTVDWLLREAGLTLPEIDALAISAGPGSFTGVRVGMAAWKGLALSRGLPLIAVPTLDAMTRLIPLRDGIICPLLDAKMGEVFGAIYRVESGGRNELMPATVAPVSRFLDHSTRYADFFGDGALLYQETILDKNPDARLLPAVYAAPRASVVAMEALALFEAGCTTDPAAAVPVYLRLSQAEEARKTAT